MIIRFSMRARTTCLAISTFAISTLALVGIALADSNPRLPGGPAPIEDLLVRAERLDERQALQGLQRGTPVILSEGTDTFPTGETSKYSVKTKALWTWVTVGDGVSVTLDPVVENGRTLLRFRTTTNITRFQPGKYVQEVHADATDLRIVRSEYWDFDGNGNLTSNYQEIVDHETNQVSLLRPGSAPVVVTYPQGYEISTQILVQFQGRFRKLAQGEEAPIVLLGDQTTFKLKMSGPSSYDGQQTYKIVSNPDRMQAQTTQDDMRVVLWSQFYHVRPGQETRLMQLSLMEHSIPGSGRRLAD